MNGHFALLAAVTTAAGSGMLRMGVIRGALKSRARRHKCAACGRLLSRSGCRRCGL
jgi:hypothetical protein